MSSEGFGLTEGDKEETKEKSVEEEIVENVHAENPAVTSPPVERPSPGMTAVEEAQRASDLRNTEATLKDMEIQFAKLRAEKDQVQSSFESMQIQLKQASESSETMRKKLQEREIEHEELQRESLTYKAKCTTLEVDCKAKDERLDRLAREADDLREEVSRLTESNKASKSTIADMESQTRLLSTESIPYQYEVQRLKTDLDAMSAQTKWLESELANRNDQIIALTKENNSKVYEIRLELDEMTARNASCEADLEGLRRSYAALESRAEKSSSENLQLRQEIGDSKLEAEQNLNAERRVVQLQKEQIDILQRKHDDAVRQMESMQELARQAADESRRELEAIRAELEEEANRILDEQAEEFRSKIKALEAKIEELTSGREAEDFLLGSPARASRRVVASITGGDEKQAGEEEEELPLNLTDAYTLLRKTEQDLREERKNHKLAQLRMRRIEEDIKAKMPHYIRQRQEYDAAVARDYESRQRLKQAVSDLNSYRLESQELRQNVVRLQKQNGELEQETKELAKQVQALLASRAGVDTVEGIPTSIEEIQSQNQKLLRELSILNNELQVLKSDPLRSKLEAAEKEIESLKEERQRSEVYFASIVQQRDLLRAQLHLESKVQESEAEQSSTSAFSVSHAERIKELEAKNKQLQEDVEKLQAETIRLQSEKDAAADRLVRYEAQVTTLSETVDSYLSQVASSKAELARSDADASYHREKCARLQDSLERSAAEAARATEAKNSFQNHNARLQDALAESTANCSQLKQELSQAERKIRLVEALVESAKSAEARAAEEAERLRNEMARNGNLLETIHRIESTLTAKAEEESRRLEEEVTRLRELLTSAQSKHAVEVESLNERTHELQTELKELAKRKDEALTNLVQSTEKIESFKGEIETLTAKCGQLESQLRTARKRLGEADGDEDDVEAALQTKIDALSIERDALQTELVAAKESVTMYQKIAKDSEDALAELTKATDIFKATKEAELEELQRHMAVSKQESANQQEAVVELTRDLSGLREEHGKEVTELKKRIVLLESEAEQLRQDSAEATKLIEQFKTEVEQLKGEVNSAQENYERELSLHAAARIANREVRDELLKATNDKNNFQSEVQGLQAELLEKQKAWDVEKITLEERSKQHETEIAEVRVQNELLHSQLEGLNNLVEKTQSGRISAASGDTSGQTDLEDGKNEAVAALQKNVSELRELIRFLRSEKEMLQVQLDTARRAAERERSSAAVARKSLDEARNELRVLQSNEDTMKGPSSAQPADQERLRSLDAQVQLLHDSNKLLREQTEKLEKSLAASNLELEEAKKALDPYKQAQRKLEVEKSGLEAEKASLLRENEAWKGRLQSLVSKFNQIDPVEHENALKQVDSLKKELETHRAQKKATEDESQRIKAMAAKVNKEVSQLKATIESQKKTIARLTAEKESLANTTKSASLSAKERENLKEKIKMVEEENASVKTELTGANDRNEKLRERLRQFQKVILTQKESEKSLKERFVVLEGELSQMREERAASQAVSSKTAPTIDATQSQETGKSADDSKSSNQTTPVGGTASSDKPIAIALPSIPRGGFNFGPDRPSTAVVVEKALPSSQSDGSQSTLPAGNESLTGRESKTDPVAITMPPTEDQSAGKAVTISKTQIAKKPPPPAESEVIVIDDETPSTDEVPEEKTDEVGKVEKEPRRPSGEKKEQSLKEKLLMQKKRRLQAELAQKKAKLSATSIQAEEIAVKKRGTSDGVADSETIGEPPMKKTKPAEVIREGETSGIATPTQGIDEPKTETVSVAVLEKQSVDESHAKDGEQSEAEDRVEEAEITTNDPDEQNNTAVSITENVPETKSGGEPSDPLTSATASTIVNPFAAAGSSVTGDVPTLPSKIVFGKASGEKNLSSKSFEAVEGSTIGTFPGSSTPPLFGKSASIIMPPAAATGFGALSAEASSVAYGSGAFLENLKPPGSVPVPKFSFGKTGPITLPTPANPIPSASPFDAFPSAEVTQSNETRTQTLFGQPLTEVENVDDAVRGSGGDSEGPASQDASMGEAEDDGTMFI